MKRLNFLKALVLAPFAGAVSTVKAESPKKNFIWKEEDIKAGLYIVLDREFDINERPGYVATLTSQIGYSFGNYESKIQTGYRINSIADGWSHGIIHPKIIGNYTKKDLVDYLNGIRPSISVCDKWNEKGERHRPLTKEELHKIIDYCSKNFIE